MMAAPANLRKQVSTFPQLPGGRIAAALFDFDGTLVDTMPLHCEAYRRVFAEIGLELTREDFYRHIGGNARETIPKMLAGRPCTLAPREIHDRKKLVVKTLLSDGPIAILETAKLLTVFAGNLPMALVSSGSREGIEIVLSRFGWNRYFNAVITGEDTERGKPAPDSLLMAADKLGVSPVECVVFEDTDAGIEAARAAGMTPFDVRAVAAPSSYESRQ
jgi:beta-phosphoglucomutase